MHSPLHRLSELRARRLTPDGLFRPKLSNTKDHGPLINPMGLSSPRNTAARNDGNPSRAMQLGIAVATRSLGSSTRSVGYLLAGVERRRGIASWFRGLRSAAPFAAGIEVLHDPPNAVAE